MPHGSTVKSTIQTQFWRTPLTSCLGFKNRSRSNKLLTSRRWILTQCNSLKNLPLTGQKQTLIGLSAPWPPRSWGKLSPTWVNTACWKGSRQTHPFGSEWELSIMRLSCQRIWRDILCCLACFMLAKDSFNRLKAYMPKPLTRCKKIIIGALL